MNWLPPLRLAQNILLSTLGRPKRPYKLTFAITNRCNARCLACTIWQKPETPSLSLAEIECFIKKNNYFSWIDLTGGEPFLRPDIIPLITLILRHSPYLYHLHLPTNAVSAGLTIQRIEEILALRPHQLTITLSLDGPLEQHDTLRGTPGNWQSVMKVYHHFHLHPHPRLQLFFGFTLSELNLGHFNATMAAVHKEFPHCTPRQWHMNIAHQSSHYYANDQIELRSVANQLRFQQEITAFRRIKQRFLDPVAFLETTYLQQALSFIRTNRTPLPCKAMVSSLFLAADGGCFPCSIWDHPLGNLREFDYNLTALYAGEAAIDAKQKIIDQQCAHCWTPCDAYPTILGNLFTVLFRSNHS